MNPLIEFCQANLSHDIQKAIDIFQADNDVDVEIVDCLSRCDVCASTCYCLVDGQLVYAKNADKLIDKVYDYLNQDNLTKIDQIYQTVEDLAMTQEQILNITPSAAQQVKQLFNESGVPEYYLRISAHAGGCGCSGGGIQYGMVAEEAPSEYDTIIESEGVKLLVDQNDIDLLTGTMIDFAEATDELPGGFTIDNPNAANKSGGCCGGGNHKH